MESNSRGKSCVDSLNGENTVSDIDTEKFRLRRFVERLDSLGEVTTIKDSVDLTNLAAAIEANEKAVLFKQVGPDKLELVANVNGSRKRLAVAFETDEANVISEFQRRLDNPQPVVDVKQEDAPVQKVVLQGDDADLTKLPFYIQHHFDGSAYLSSGIDYCIDPETGTTNVGCRRLSLRNSKTAGTNVTAPSDLKRIYQGCVARGEKLPISFAVGSHPIDYMAAGMRIPSDEISLVSTLRGEPLPLVKSLTNDIRVPADAEMVIEGYFDERGYVEPDGPYGEYVGFYGPMHMDPVFHVTAITMRDDMLHQSLLHGSGPEIHRAESVQLLTIRHEAQVFKILRVMGVIVRDVFVPPGSAEGQHIRVSIKQVRLGQARNVIAAIFASVFGAKHVFVTDDDVNIRDENSFEWAFVSRFQADRDMVVFNGMMGMPMDPSLDGKGIIGAKAGFDLTLPLQSRGKLSMRVAKAPKIKSAARYQSVTQALKESGPLFFTDIVDALGSRDGREIAVQLDEIRGQGKLMRNGDGQYLLGQAEKGTTGLHGPQHDDPNAHT
jgi:2,5-furandicarboxylate decarboxylase 1